MFVAMNRFKVHPESAHEFETAWLKRESYLSTVPGFVRFSLLRGDVDGDYISHSTWRSRSEFEAWTRSEAFKSAHAQRLDETILADHPKVSLYEAVISEGE